MIDCILISGVCKGGSENNACLEPTDKNEGKSVFWRSLGSLLLELEGGSSSNSSSSGGGGGDDGGGNE
ncbi:hypothetical protein M0804_013444 [Polistes exclamans]|nr:hypothetical protein M0804_013444 [Polistes exclamans]